MGEVCDECNNRCNESGTEECLSLAFGRGKPMSKNNARENLHYWLRREKKQNKLQGEKQMKIMMALVVMVENNRYSFALRVF